MQKLELREPAGIDCNWLSYLYRELGDRRADRVVCEAMERLALALARVDWARKRGDLADVVAQARVVQEEGARIGLPKLSRVAGDVRACAEAAAMPALDATLARLSRIGDVSLSKIWDPKDLIV
jgi:hypothetical protein